VENGGGKMIVFQEQVQKFKYLSQIVNMCDEKLWLNSESEIKDREQLYIFARTCHTKKKKIK
jgi:hypothetical protein